MFNLFKKKKEESTEPITASVQIQPNESLTSPISKKNSYREIVAKYPKPKIMLIDLPEVDPAALRSRGHNILQGSFGSPYTVSKSISVVPMIANAKLPNFTEQEIIIIDLKMPPGEKLPTDLSDYDDEKHLYTSCVDGIIDARIPAMFMCRKHFDRIYRYGGLFIIFAQPRLSYNVSFGGPHKKEMTLDTWSFLSMLDSDYIRTERADGMEINYPEVDHELMKYIKEYSDGCRFNTIIEPAYQLGKKNWIPLMHDKYGRCIGGMIWQEESKKKVLILPPLTRHTDSILQLIEKVLPDISSHLFPYIEGDNWVHRDEYELQSILELNQRKKELNKQTQARLSELDKKIEDERNKLGYLHGLLTNTGPELVKCVEKSLRLIEFSQIVNVDEELKQGGRNYAKQEDLQIHDRKPTLLVEVKGINSIPKEADLFQVIKYVNRRMREWNHTEVRGMTIINHQRRLPAIERNNDNVFTQAQIEDAIQNNCSLLSTYDLFLFIMGILKWEWNAKSIQDLFYVDGRMQGPPLFYEYIGRIKHFYDNQKVISVEVEKRNLFKGQRIGYITKKGYFEEDVTSIHLNHVETDQGTVGQRIGVKSIYDKSLIKEGMAVYEVVKQN